MAADFLCREDWTGGNLGISALRKFIKQHKCNDLCKRLKLKEPVAEPSLRLKRILVETGLASDDEASLSSASHLQAKKNKEGNA